MVILLPVSRHAAFDPDATHAMGEAYDKVCASLHDVGQPNIVREVIANLIIEEASKGERDPARLCAKVLMAFGNARP
jgi:hypothetical protein